MATQAHAGVICGLDLVVSLAFIYKRPLVEQHGGAHVGANQPSTAAPRRPPETDSSLFSIFLQSDSNVTKLEPSLCPS